MTIQRSSRANSPVAARLSQGAQPVSQPAVPPIFAPESEAHLQAAIIRAAKALGWATYHTHDSRRSTRGWPDLALCKPPRFILAELKTNSGRLTPEQSAWLDVLRLCPGIEVHVWRPKNWRDVIRVLQGLP